MQSAVPRNEWEPFFDRMSKSLLGKRAEIKVAALDLGDQITVEWVPMIGISYDSKENVLDVTLDRFEHLIHHSKEVLTDEVDGTLASVAIRDADGATQIVRMKDRLPAS